MSDDIPVFTQVGRITFNPLQTLGYVKPKLAKLPTRTVKLMPDEQVERKSRAPRELKRGARGRFDALKKFDKRDMVQIVSWRKTHSGMVRKLKDFTWAGIAKRLGYTENQVKDAYRVWRKKRWK